MHFALRWLNRDESMRQWFAEIAKREDVMLFITEMLQEPGLDKFIVKLLLRRGNDMALRSMLDHWVHTDGSFASVFDAFSKKPGVDRALARVVISPGASCLASLLELARVSRQAFWMVSSLGALALGRASGNRHVRKFLWQDGLIELALEALALVRSLLL